jgi:hypothetical protein
MESVAADINDLPDLEEPDSLAMAIVWCSTFQKHARRADALDSEFDISPVTPIANRTPAACPTVMETFATAIEGLPDLEEPVHSYIWREAFMKHARRADEALAEFHRELGVCVCPVDTLRDSCTNLKELCTNLHTAATATSSTLASLVVLMGIMHKAANAKVNLFDIAALANAKYHGGGEGYYPLTPAIIHKCGYTAINTINANEIFLVHESVLTNWVGCHTVGPQIDRILEKGLASLPRLQFIEVESAVEWYNTLQKTFMIYLVPITPLDCVMIKMGNKALCIPGTGLTR